MKNLTAEPLLIEKSRPGKRAIRYPKAAYGGGLEQLGDKQLRADAPGLPELGELEVVRHFTRLSKLNLSIDGNFYPLGSCTMKYNPKINDQLALEAGFAAIHPSAPDAACQGTLELLYGLERGLSELCGMDAFSLQPSAGAQGELVGVLVARAYHRSRGDEQRTEILIPDSAHGTNPASAAFGGFTVATIPSDARGRVDLSKLKEKLGPKTAMVMITVPSTLGLFERQIVEIAEAVHAAGGLVYMDGANFNALIGLVRPGDFGIDVLHLNLHKTFSTPHGGGGPGAGPVGVKKHLEPFLPVPRVVKDGETFRLASDEARSIGRVRSFFGNTGVLVRAYAYFRRHGPRSFGKIAEAAILNANYVKEKLKDLFPAFIDEACMHECTLQTKPELLGGVKTLDVAKRLLDMGFYAPTVYFPLIVPESMMIEPTETESKATLDAFIAAMRKIADEAKTSPETVKTAPHETPVRRLDEVRAAREPDLRWPA